MEVLAGGSQTATVAAGSSQDGGGGGSSGRRRLTWWKTGLRRQVVIRSGLARLVPATMDSQVSSSRLNDTSKNSPLRGDGSSSTAIAVRKL